MNGSVAVVGLPHWLVAWLATGDGAMTLYVAQVVCLVVLVTACVWLVVRR